MRYRSKMALERAGRAEAFELSCVDIRNAGTRGLAQRLKAGFFFRVAAFNQPQPITQHFARVLITACRYKVFDQVRLMVCENYIASRHKR